MSEPAASNGESVYCKQLNYRFKVFPTAAMMSLYKLAYNACVNINACQNYSMLMNAFTTLGL